MNKLKSELGYPISLEELCGNKSITMGGSFGVGQVLLEQFKAFCNRAHAISNGDKQITICAYNLATHGQPPSDVNKEVPMVT
jgi:hypothetical protein